ncbi:E3 ubiquitin-protein ligase MIB2-like isoform X2 [Octopus sinensis]|uniref:RING-type E3 ubiquitin transferase n=1 Tax=Octopus sinensis TaxID=2607531 RepID=A0A6P7TJR3_9MOLL|nr:E3 ubiquitin-protein ligase MIB2-like isoform X2 [Octopus sinensis]
MDVGLRVTRGPDWKWGNQDGGVGNIGTVIEIGKPGSATSPDKTVVVQWDHGSRTNYRIGYQGAYDLRVFDNAPSGVKHTSIICDSCNKSAIQGMRWRCLTCHDFDLCTVCYHGDKHDIKHSFLRFDTPASKGVKMPKRANSTKMEAWGIFKGAKVLRGNDWDWGNQDGGEGKPGKVRDIRGWDLESGRSVANVVWSNSQMNVYRVGHKGKVDLKATQCASGGMFYVDHLPVLGEFTETSASGEPTCHFKVGDRVRVDLDMEILKVMQEGHGGWNPRMAEYIGQVGSVHRITDRGDVRVQYEGCSNRWTFHPGALTKVQLFAIGDSVQIIEDIRKVKEYQKGHGEWTDSMASALGKIGKVKQVYPDGDLLVAVSGKKWTYNPLCCAVAPNSPLEVNNIHSMSDREEDPASLTELLEQLLNMSHKDTRLDQFVREAAQGQIDNIREVITKHPDKIDQRSSGKTALQVASHQGHKDIVIMLLDAGANLELQDEDGDTALHYSAFGNQPEVMELLLLKGANINAFNKGGCSTLHVAVNKQFVKCVRVLLKHSTPVNIQDAYGDTALHDAIGKENRQIIDFLVSYPGIDYTLRNNRGFNVLHHAALKGNNFATERILQKCRHIVDIKKDDGFAALHLAALNGHREVANTLLTVGQAQLDIRNNRQQTPLLLAVSQGHIGLTEFLVSKGAEINAEDEDGDICLHLALLRQTVGSESEHSQVLDGFYFFQIRSQLGLSEEDERSGVVVACYLAQRGADLYHKNHRKVTPLDIIGDSILEERVKRFAAISMGQQVPDHIDDPRSHIRDCLLCSDKQATVKFQPCGHVVTCEDCSLKIMIKKCIQCKVPVTSKIGIDGSQFNILHSSPSSLDSKHQQIQELEEQITCSICMERRRNMAFVCGHTTCKECGEVLKQCHMCRKPIQKKIILY